MKVVMYHHFRSKDSIGIFPHAMNLDRFKRQLEFFAKEYGFVSKAEWQRFVEEGYMPEKCGKILLTFDDATKCHYELAYRELISRDLWGIFFASASPLSTSNPLSVHLVQLLCANVRIQYLLEETEDILDRWSKEGKIVYSRCEASINYGRHRVQDSYQVFKDLVNSKVSYSLQADLILHLLNKFRVNVNSLEIYATCAELREMQKDGMQIECHSDQHRLFSRLDNVEQLADLTTATAVLRGMKLLKNMGYCHPFGGPYSYDEHTLKILKNLNYRYAFSVEEREIVESDYFDKLYQLPRFDCNSFEPI